MLVQHYQPTCTIRSSDKCHESRCSGARHEKLCFLCTTITTADGQELEWVDEIRYLGVYIVRATKFKCSTDHTKRSFYRAANSIFGKIGRIASEEVILQLIKSKCVPVLLYGLEVCALNKSQIASLDFAINGFFVKMFKINNINIVKSCQEYFYLIFLVLFCQDV